MIQSAQNYPVSEILNTERDIKFVIPKYQREYVWGKWNWESLFDDIWENEKGHFLGSIICINQNRDALSITELELVDGQQRLTTLSIFYAAIYAWLNKNADLTDGDLFLEVNNLKYRLIQKSDRKTLKIELSYQRNNFHDYRSILQEIGLLKDVQNVSNYGNRQIYRAYRYFADRLKATNGDNEPIFNITEILELLKKLNAASLVKIEVNSHSDAFTLFETLNNRGVPLSATDLIKNKLLAELERKEKNSIHDNFSRWDTILTQLTEDPQMQQRFLRQYYNTFKVKDNFIAIKNISQATKSNLIRVYDSLIDKNPYLIFEELSHKARLYNRLVAPDNEQNSSGLTNSLHDLNRIGGVTSYGLLLYLLAERHLPDEELKEVVDLLVKYFVRRSLTDIPATRDLDRIFIDIIEKLHVSKDIPAFPIIKETITQPNRFAADELVEAKLRGNMYEDNAGTTRFILCKLEEVHGQTIEIYTDLWKPNDSGQYVWTIEHILPQTRNITQPWVDMIANGDRDLAKKYHEEQVNKLGNLTISGYNQNLGTLSFSEKRDRKDKLGRFIGYKNGLFLNRNLANKDTWTPEDITIRTNEMVELAMHLFI